MEKPYIGNALFEESFNSLKIIIPAKTNYFTSIFLTFWLCGWAFGEVTAITSIVKGGIEAPFLLVWLAGWTLGGGFVLRVLVWNFAGKEIITVANGELSIDKKNLLFYKPKTYGLDDTKRLRVRDDTPPFMNFFGRRNDMGAFTQNGTIQFDYGMKTVRFGSGVEEAEATYILQKLKDKRLVTERNF